MLAAGTYVAARTLGTWELHLLAYALAALVLVAWLLVFSAGRRLTAARTVWPDQPTAGDSLRVTVEVTNQSVAPGPQISVKDVTGDLGVGEDELQLESLPPRTTRMVSAEIPSARRGVFTLPSLRVQTDDPLGLVQARRVTGSRSTVTVYPRLPHLDSCAALGHLQGGRSPSSGGPAALGGSELRGVRPHNPGEPLNHVDWKATARTGTLMLREMEDPAVGDVSVVVDGSAAGDTRLVDESFECAVEAAGALAEFALRGGRTVGMALHDAAWQEVTLSPGIDAGRRLRETLAGAGSEATVPLAARLQHATSREDSAAHLHTWIFVLRALDGGLARSLATLRRRGSSVLVVLVEATEEASRTAGRAVVADLRLSLAAADVPCLSVRPVDDLHAALSPTPTSHGKALIS